MYFSVEFSKKNITLIFEDKQQTKNTTWNNKFKFIQFHTYINFTALVFH